MWAGIFSSLGAWVRQERKEEGPGWSPQGGERKHGSTASHPPSPCILTRWAASSTAHPQCHDILPPSQAQSNETKLTPLKPRVTMNLPSFGLFLSILLAIATRQQHKNKCDHLLKQENLVQTPLWHAVPNQDCEGLVTMSSCLPPLKAKMSYNVSSSSTDKWVREKAKHSLHS